MGCRIGSRLWASRLAFLGVVVAACTDPASRWEVGGIYSISDANGFGVAKILAIDPGAVSVRLYKGRYSHRPTTADPRKLMMLGRIGDPDGFGIGHMPVAPRAFAIWFPVHITSEPVKDEELDGYRIWKESGAGAFTFDDEPADEENTKDGTR